MRANDVSIHFGDWALLWIRTKGGW